MCGIVGLIKGKEFKKHKEASNLLSQMLYAGALRGFDSTGVLLHHSYNGTDSMIYKRALPSPDFITLDAYTRVILPAVEKFGVVIGHNRAATKGGIYNHTAHPFEFNHVSGVHNGTLHYKSVMGCNSSAVDSENIFEALDKYNTKEVLESLDGAYALTWYDTRDKKIKLARNKDRPLSLAYVKDQDLIVISSEEGMSEWLIPRCGFVIEDIFTIETGTVYSFDPDDFGKVVKEDFTPKVWTSGFFSGGTYRPNFSMTCTTGDVKYSIGRVIKFVLAKINETQTSVHISGYVDDDGDDDLWPTVKATLCKTDASFPLVAGNTYTGVINYKSIRDCYIELGLREIKPTVKIIGPNNKPISIDKFDELTSDGCCVCGKDINMGDNVTWLKTDLGHEPMCESCTTTYGSTMDIN